MRTHNWILVAGLWLTVSLVEAARGAEPVEIGTRIYPKSIDVQIRGEDRIIGTAVDLVYPLTVRKVDGDRLRIWVEKTKAEGWIQRSDVCTAREAIRHFTQKIAANATDAEAYQTRSEAWEELGYFDQAVDDATQVIRLRPDSAAAYCSRGVRWYNRDDYENAVKDYDEAIRIDPKFADAYFKRARASEEVYLRNHILARWQTVVADYSEAIRLDPSHALAYYHRGRNRWRGEQTKAIADYSEAIRLDPKFADAYFGRGEVWHFLSKYDKAIADFDEAIRLDPTHARAYESRGLVWSEKNDLDKAIADYNEAIRFDPKFTSAYSNRGIAWRAKGEFDKAIADHNEMIRLQPKPEPYYRVYPESYHIIRCITWKEMGEFDKALADCDEAISQFQRHQYYVIRGDLWMAKRELNKALADYDESIRLSPDGHSAAYLSRGVALRTIGEWDKALADFNKAIRLWPQSANAYNNRAWLYATCPNEKYRDGPKAVKDATKACGLWGGKNNANFHDTLAAAYAEAGQFDKAVKTQRQARDLAPETQKADYQTRIDLYKSGQPYREGPKEE